MKKYLRSILLAAPVVGGLAFVSFRQDDRLFEIARNLDIYATLFKELNAYYVDEINPNQLIKTSIDNMLRSLDPYTVYYAEDDIEDYMTMTTGKYNGIGAMVNSADGKHTVMMVYEDTPAQKAGLQLGDEITKINDIDLSTREDFDTGKLLKGQTQTAVKLTVKRYGITKPLEITLNRDIVKVTNVPYYGMLNEDVGYIDLKDFTATASREVRNAFQELKGKGMKSVVLDLRDNPGGLLNMAIEISNIFIPKGEEVVSTKGKVSEWNKTYTAYNPALDTEIPVVVLTNNRSASAAEIVSGVIQDYDRGVLIGQRTYGKGLVQTTRDLSFNTKMKITTAKYYIPSGRCIQAIDYSHRNDDGSVGKIPDSLMTEFKTRNGRVVFDGGGILPDIITEKENFSPLAVSLGRNRLFFDYAVKYHFEHPTIKSAKEFQLTDADYAAFTKWLGDKEYDYTTQVERDLKDLEASAKKEKSLEVIEDQLKALKSKLSHSKDNDLQIFKPEIKKILEEEIIKHYYLEKGMREASFNEDPEVKAALALFKDPARYSQILKKK
ncbi:carboxyl-terminal processing protease [Dyadobacter sp. BE34]|uniref:Carboxyl-terminal processing protease n=1 Tax=Dyadobacter fermentans TaxID=94254 RepID=A0ABU1R7B6_9BACT|nr:MULTISPECIES: S41 family peptidase [Dyadobacter]MBZ1360860.1 S41 family peptidase [Dyadobacter fermentans]MDR6809291.1 carboxyl-terminal processing protease [Dyadobacter fermentans]MDR7047115.1 carboxyl-terminal processing protease [Dyadobacter sp. BE242]MDR7194918.1 carboxyl-terminal processing protease [Dyadobacter sp. BE34]MDR7214537.1 carboxyl-terminal processing protease [Dyadobacter sp. BE31]